MIETDARFEELKFLADVDRGTIDIVQYQGGDRRRDMVAHMLADGLLNGVGNLTWTYSLNQSLWGLEVTHRVNRLERAIATEHWKNLDLLLGGQEVRIRISHRGRVRLA